MHDFYFCASFGAEERERERERDTGMHMQIMFTNFYLFCHFCLCSLSSLSTVSCHTLLLFRECNLNVMMRKTLLIRISGVCVRCVRWPAPVCDVRMHFEKRKFGKTKNVFFSLSFHSNMWIVTPSLAPRVCLYTKQTKWRYTGTVGEWWKTDTYIDNSIAFFMDRRAQTEKDCGKMHFRHIRLVNGQTFYLNLYLPFDLMIDVLLRCVCGKR